MAASLRQAMWQTTALHDVSIFYEFEQEVQSVLARAIVLNIVSVSTICVRRSPASKVSMKIQGLALCVVVMAVCDTAECSVNGVLCLTAVNQIWLGAGVIAPSAVLDTTRMSIYW